MTLLALDEASTYWTENTGFGWFLFVATGVVVGLMAYFAWTNFVPDPRSDPALGPVLAREVLRWQVDRTEAIAKGVAKTAVGFLTTLLVGVLKANEFAAPGIAIVGCAAGALAALGYAALLSGCAKAKYA